MAAGQRIEQIALRAHAYPSRLAHLVALMARTAPGDRRGVLSGQAMHISAQEQPIAAQRVLCGDAADGAGVSAQGMHWFATSFLVALMAAFFLERCHR